MRKNDSDNESPFNINTNRYVVLSQELEQNSTQNVETERDKKEPKPPPIFVPDVNSIKELATTLNQAVNTEDYCHKTVRFRECST